MSIYLTTLTLLSGMFVLGAISLLYRIYKTNILKLITIFIFSILLISTNFWSYALFDRSIFIFELFSFIGCSLCIIVLPYLTMNLISKKLPLVIERVIWGWNIVYIVLGISFIVTPGLIFVIPLVGYMLLLSIALWIVILAINIKYLSSDILKSSLKRFIILSAIFLAYLILDMLITTLPIESLRFLDNTSLTFYFLGINIGTFFFAGKFLNRNPYIENGKLTKSFKERFSLTPREGEIIEKVYEGKTNNSIGEELFISGKTVENHLRNIYQKIEISSRTQLIIELNSWKRV